ncbi:hypothetical protein ES703_104155 [subsurface metagenome]
MVFSLAEEENSGHGNPGEGFVPIPFCDERTKRIEAKIDGMENRILNALNKRNSLSWQAKATILGSFIIALSSITVALIYVCA